jgi:hypothetical protein
LFDYYDVKVSNNENINMFWITYPKEKFPGKPDYIFGDLSLGFPSTTKKIYSTKTINLYNNLFTARIPKEWIVLQCPFIDYDKYIITSNSHINCDENTNENDSIIIFSLPKCNIWEMAGLKAVDINSGIPLYHVDSEYISGFTENKQYFVTAFERERCIVFSEYNSKEIKLITTSLSEFLENIKKI